MAYYSCIWFPFTYQIHSGKWNKPCQKTLIPCNVSEVLYRSSVKRNSYCSYFISNPLMLLSVMRIKFKYTKQLFWMFAALVKQNMSTLQLHSNLPACHPPVIWMGNFSPRDHMRCLKLSQFAVWHYSIKARRLCWNLT